MVFTKQMNVEARQEENDADQLQDLDDAGETLSLCDLPLTASSSHCRDDYSKEDQSFDDDQDFVGFFSEYFTAPSYDTTTDDIVFCGRHVPYKGEEEDKDQEIIAKTRSKRNRVFPWLSDSSKDSRTASSKQLQGRSYDTCNKTLSAYDHKSGLSVKQASVLATPVKSRWYLFAFGMGRFPLEMELSDIKMRQSKKKSSEKMSQRPNNGEKAHESGGGRGAKGLWGLLRRRAVVN